jgi:hypothetical protein
LWVQGGDVTRFLDESSHAGAYRFFNPGHRAEPSPPFPEKPCCYFASLAFENENLAEGDGQHSNLRRTLMQARANMNATSHI